MRIAKIVGAFLCFLTYSQILYAQEEKEILKTGIELGTGLSYSGIQTNLAFVGFYKGNEFYLGPKITVTNAYLPQNGPWGIQGGYRRILISKEKLTSFVNLDYQLAFRKPYNPTQLVVNTWNRIHEFHLHYGFTFKVFNRFYIGNQIGIGAYLEKNIDLIEDIQRSFSGFSSQFKLFFQYRF